MSWKEIVTRITTNSPNFAEEVGLTPSSDPYDKAKCCGGNFGDHLTWKGVWLHCNPTKLAAWTRKKNREAKLRKKAEAIEAAR